MKDFATYILEEKDYIQKMMIVYYLSMKRNIYFDKSIVLRTEIAKLFMDYKMINLDKNTVLTAMLLCNCKKVDDAQKIGKLEVYAQEGAEYLSTLGFSKRFCKICEEVNRYSGSSPREKESDVLEIVDQFTGLVLNRPERPAFSVEEALIILKERNFKKVENRYLTEFIAFVEDMGKITIKDRIEVPIIKKLISLHNNEESAKSYISVLANHYVSKFDELISKNIDKSTKDMLESENKNKGNKKKSNNVTHHVKRYKRVYHNANRALFSKEIADRIMKHESIYRIED